MTVSPIGDKSSEQSIRKSAKAVEQTAEGALSVLKAKLRPAGAGQSPATLTRVHGGDLAKSGSAVHRSISLLSIAPSAQNVGAGLDSATRFKNVAGELLRSVGIQPEPAALVALQALMAEQQTLDPVVIRRLRDFVKAHPGRERHRAELGARAQASALELDDPLVSALANFFDDAPADGSGARNPDAHHSSANEQKPSRLTSEELASSLESACLSSISALDYSSLARPGPDGRAWLYIPFQFLKNTLDFRGILRILYNYCLKSTEKIVLSVKLGASVYAFELDPEHQACSLVESGAEPLELRSPDRRRLTAALQSMGVSLNEAPASVLPQVSVVDSHV